MFDTSWLQWSLEQHFGQTVSLPVTWLARHTQCDRPYLFTDEQIEGPMDYWQHRHQFSEENGQTRLTDSIRYEIPFAALSEPLMGWFVGDRLRDMFRYRHEVTQRECEQLGELRRE